ncbi:hypothetical protein, partial [Leptospira alstonii]|uniref:hypothetical protein n=1 Tax=Leptospira alstonii TaxID=28452 RepID=UPI000774216C
MSFDRLKEFTLNLFRFCKLDFVKSSWKRLGILKKRCFHFWSRTDKDRSSNEDIIFPALLFLIGASTVLWEEALQEKDPSNQLKLISLIYGLQIVSFLLLRPVLRSILKVEQSLSIQKYILFAVFVSITFLITFEEHWTLAFYGGILTFAVASFLSAETSYVIFKQKLAFRLYYISIIPLSMGFIFFGNVISNLFLNVNLNYLSYLVYGIVLIFLYRINSKTSVASILPNQPAPTDAVKQGSQLLKEIDISNVEEKLNSFIEAKQYRDSNFRLSDLSLHLGISLHQTSCYLNQHKGISF